VTRSISVLEPGPHTAVQDQGRAGLAHLGVPRSGWADPAAARLANRLVGNDEHAAVLECVLGGLHVRVRGAMSVAVTGARCALFVDGRPAPFGAAVSLVDGQVLALGVPRDGVRSWLAVTGGVDVPPVLGSRSTDTLAGLGPPVLDRGMVLPVGPTQRLPGLGEAVHDAMPARELRWWPGPRADWFDPAELALLDATPYVVQPDSNRVALRLEGAALRRVRSGELESEGLVLGAIQAPASGQPLVFLQDHPTTGGYPVVGVVDEADLAGCAQLRPGDEVRFRRLPG
jgi:biotin-dependent carboxylase-like uncharacterized protein